jgi:hypothetical protein
MTTPYIEVSTLTCPNCGYAREETMPVDVCQFFYECESCGTMLRPEKGDCCVYCSYGSVKCPMEQMADQGLNFMDTIDK